MPKRPNECAELLLALSKNPLCCFLEVAESAVAGLDFIGTHDSTSDHFDWEMEERLSASVPKFLENLLRGLELFKSSTLCVAAAEKIALRPEIFSQVALVVPAIERICVGRRRLTAAVDSSIRHLWTSAAEFLLGRSEVPPQPPSDWRLKVASAGKLACSPDSPPERDYYFQYSWVIPGIFSTDARVRRHFWFGCPFKYSSSEIAFCVLESGQTRRTGHPLCVGRRSRVGGCNGVAGSLPSF